MLVAFGLLDCVTTIVGIACFGAKETNPLMAAITETDLVAFAGIKLAAVAFTGVLFYKAGSVGNVGGSKFRIGTRFVQLAYSLSLFAAVTVVSNNVLVMAKIV